MANDDSQFGEPTISVGIDIIPNSKHNRIHFHRKRGPIGLIQVAILSTSDLDAPSVLDRTSLTFGTQARKRARSPASMTPGMSTVLGWRTWFASSGAG